MTDLVPAGPLDVNDALVAERAAFVSLLQELTPDQWRTPSECPAWDVHGVALHVLGDDLSLLSRQRDAATNGLLLYAEHHADLDFRGLLDGFNERWVTAAEFFSTELTIELLRLTGDWTARFYRETDPETLGEPVLFFGGSPAPYWQIASREYVERWIHHQQILRALALPDLGPDLLLPAAAAVARGLAANLGIVEAAPGATVTFAIEGLSSWTAQRGDDGWTLCDGRPSSPTTEVVLTTEEAPRSLSSGQGPLVSIINRIAEDLRSASA